ncbi:Hus1-like protein [Conidiobolus coronatus NRRL 28638]|uniref:Checkpoint protein n=1 Tax=Conidiobolus coronatus (strain ATCC 28846 / CBS 209.66 / NRRL 28638) TaxID=796925 RepID=A0A137NWY8_CONC2|nr:Hus1-like protein [Conidiobolus coronatus NRRL 28638]|eukprot:KXN67355.1 Hus1-like protein [Conidiobolus coronatus NRRL 28638]
MKFSATFRSTQLIHKICQIFEKVHKMCLLHLTKDYLTFVVRGEVGQEPQVWLQVKMDQVFADFTIKSAHQDKIYLELDASHWVRSLKESILGINSTLKLTKSAQGQVVLKMVIDEKSSKPGKFSTVTHDIPVRVLLNSQFNNIAQPTMEEFTMRVQMPTLISLRHVIERLKTLGQLITINANWNGFFQIKMQSEKCDINTTYPISQSQIQFENDSSLLLTEIEKETIVSTTVDIKHFSQLLECYQLNPWAVILNYSHNNAILAKILLNDDEYNIGGKLDLDYFIPFKYN